MRRVLWITVALTSLVGAYHLGYSQGSDTARELADQNAAAAAHALKQGEDCARAIREYLEPLRQRPEQLPTLVNARRSSRRAIGPVGE